MCFSQYHITRHTNALPNHFISKQTAPCYIPLQIDWFSLSPSPSLSPGPADSEIILQDADPPLQHICVFSKAGIIVLTALRSLTHFSAASSASVHSGQMDILFAELSLCVQPGECEDKCQEKRKLKCISKISSYPSLCRVQPLL